MLIVPRHLQKCNKNYLKESSSKTAEATGDLIGNKTADKIIKYWNSNLEVVKSNKDIPNENYISPEKRQ